MKITLRIMVLSEIIQVENFSLLTPRQSVLLQIHHPDFELDDLLFCVYCRKQKFINRSLIQMIFLWAELGFQKGIYFFEKIFSQSNLTNFVKLTKK